MLKSNMLKSKLMVGFVLLFLFGVLQASISTAADIEPPLKLEERLSGLSQEESRVLKKLFALAQEIQLMGLEEAKLDKEQKMVNQSIEQIQSKIEEEEAYYIKQQDALKEVLRMYQKMGPGSYLEVVLDSENLSTMLRRLSALRDLARNTGKLLEDLEISKDKLTVEKQRLTDQHNLLKLKQEQQKVALENKLKLKEEQELYLSSLKDKSKFYREQLDSIQTMLSEVKPMLADAAKEFEEIIQEGNLSANALDITFSIFNIKGTLSEKTFNDILSKQETLAKMMFVFHKDQIEINIPEKKLILSGTFILQEDNMLKFQAEEGSFYEMPLEEEYVQELLSEGDLILDLKPLLGKNTLRTIQIQDGYIEMRIRPSLF